MRFRVKLKKSDGSEETKVIDATSRFAVYEAVGKEGMRVLEIAESAGFPLLASFNIVIGSEVRRQEVITMSKNLSAMLKAGLSLARALSILERQSRSKRFKEVMKDLSSIVTKGSTFHEALAAHPKAFSKLYVAMVKSGEESGGLAGALTLLGTQMERTEELVRKIRGAMIYPAIVMTAILIVAAVMLIYVVPTLTSTFSDLGVEVPLSTRVITAMSHFLINHFILVAVGAGAVVIGGIAFAKTRKGKNIIVRGSLFVPVVGRLVQETYAARASRTLASLLASGVPVLSALSITEEVIGTPHFAKVLREASERVKKGDPFSAAFVEHPDRYPLMMSDMMAVGEETGKLSEMLSQVAEFYEEDVSQKTKDLSTIVEPVLMIFVGIMVGIFAISMIAPIYSLSDAL